jgi:serine protease AprX
MKIEATFTLLAVLGFAFGMSQAPAPAAESSYIVQGSSLEAVTEAVLAVEGEITHELGIINAVAATLTESEREALEERGDLKITEDGSVKTAGGTAGGSPSAYNHFPTLVGADQVQANGIMGRSVTVAVLDSGMAAIAELQKDTSGSGRMQVRYNAIKDQEGKHNDNYGHGTHVASIIWNTDYANDGTMRRNSIAPDVRAISVKAFDGQGHGTYANVIRGLDWVLNNQAQYNIRVLNLSFSAPARSHYWDDPINQAVMQLWQAGVVVVASAGNTGPDAMTIGVPGNNP